MLLVKIVTQRQRGRPKGVLKTRVGTLLPLSLYNEVRQYSQKHLLPINAIFELALRRFLNPENPVEHIKNTPYRAFATSIKLAMAKVQIIQRTQENLLEMMTLYGVQPRLDTLKRYLAKLATEENLSVELRQGVYTIQTFAHKAEVDRRREEERKRQEKTEITKILNA